MFDDDIQETAFINRTVVKVVRAALQALPEVAYDGSDCDARADGQSETEIEQSDRRPSHHIFEAISAQIRGRSDGKIADNFGPAEVRQRYEKVVKHLAASEKKEITQNVDVDDTIACNEATFDATGLSDSYRSLLCRRCYIYDCTIHPYRPLPLNGSNAEPANRQGQQPCGPGCQEAITGRAFYSFPGGHNISLIAGVAY